MVNMMVVNGRRSLMMLPLAGVIAGLDPAVHLLAKKMDPRVKPAGDAGPSQSS
jgi:hypothetical protein